MFTDPHIESVTAGFAFDGLLRNLVVVIFTGLLVSAALTDLRRFVIPDPVVVGLLGLWPIWVALNGSGAIGLILLGAIAVFVLGVALFAFGFMGGGDVKLITVLALWAEPAGLPTFILFTSLAGGLLSIYWVLPFRCRALYDTRQSSALLGDPILSEVESSAGGDYREDGQH
jgi:prepilin peptidase CpaA